MGGLHRSKFLFNVSTLYQTNGGRSVRNTALPTIGTKHVRGPRVTQGGALDMFSSNPVQRMEK